MPGALLLAATLLALPAASAHALVVDRATARVDPVRRDQLKLVGRLDGLALENADAVTVVVDGVAFAVPLVDFKQSKRAFKYRRRDGAPGLTAFVLKRKRARFKATLGGLALGPLPGPVTVQVVAGDAGACARVRLREKGRRRKPSKPRRLKSAGKSVPCAVGTPRLRPVQLLVGDAGSVRVEVGVLGTPEGGTASLSLADELGAPVGAPLCTLADDGDPARGDAQAGDGVFTCLAAIDTAAPARLPLVAAAVLGGTTVPSPPAVLRVVGPLTADDVATITRVQDRAAAVWAERKAALGDGLQARLETVAALRGEAGVEAVTLTDEEGSITIRFASGVQGGLALTPREDPPGGVAAAVASRLARAAVEGEDEETVVVGNRDVLIWDVDYFGPSEAEVARDLFEASTCPRFDVTFHKGPAATLAALDDMWSHGTVVLVTHGTRTDQGYASGNCMLTCDAATPAAIEAWSAELARGNLLVTSTFGSHGCAGGSVLCVAPGWVDDPRRPLFDDALVWAGYCHGGWRRESAAVDPKTAARLATEPFTFDVLADAYLRKGVVSHLGFRLKVADFWAKEVASLTVFPGLVGRLDSARKAWDAVADKEDPAVRGNYFVLAPASGPSAVYLKAAITPTEAVLAGGQAAALEVTLEGAGGCALAYRWRNTATAGHLDLGDDVESPSATATYQADADGVGTETVTVDVIDTAHPERRTLATLEATIEVGCTRCAAAGGTAAAAGATWAGVGTCVPVESCCADDEDNDGDGDVDCDDADCAGDPACLSIVDLGDLGDPTGGQFTTVRDVNDAGEAVGQSQLASGATGHAFLWRDGTMTGLGTAPGTTGTAGSMLVAVNDLGVAVGSTCCFASGSRAQRWSAGTWTDINGGDTVAEAAGINDAGVIVGRVDADPSPSVSRRVPARWSGNAPVGLALPGQDSQGFAVAVNEAGQIAGETQLYDNSALVRTQAVVWDAGVPIPLATLGGVDGFATAINEAGDVVGSAESASQAARAVLWAAPDRAPLDLGSLGAERARANDVADTGRVVGRLLYTGPPLVERAFVWDGGVMKDLNTLLPPGSGWELRDAVAIDSTGTLVVGSGQRNGKRRQFLMRLPATLPP